MIRFLKNRILPVLLALSVCLSLLVVPASAASAVGSQIAAGKTTLTEALGDYPSFFEGVISYIESCEFGTPTSSYSVGVSLSTRITDSSCIFDVGSVENLHSFATAINMNDTGVKCLISQTGTGVNDYYYIQYYSVSKFHGAGFADRGGSGGLKLKYTAADENGLILVASVAAAGAVEGQWLPYNNTMPQDTTSYDNLDAIKLDLQSHGVSCQLTKMDVGYVLTRSTGVPPYYVTEVYCNAWGGMYVAPADDRVIVDDRDYIDGDGNKVNVGLDLGNGSLSLGDGTVLDITQLIYDEAAKTYYIDTLDQSTNITMSYSWTYYIDYTSITYIGQTEEYNKYYEFYYELPDGRSSADLTAEELEQLNVSLDILPYIRSADDVSIRALYHFDGDTRDSSYWSYAGDFTWNSGASITYMDAGVFNGALYLNENAHQFIITLPSNISSSDFTLQFRYYQSHTAAPVTDSSISVGGTVLMQFDGNSIKNGSGTALINADIGNWQEICIMRSGSSVLYFHNGVLIGSAGISSALGDKIVFIFGSDQQTYKYFDEFRFTQKALYSSSGYDVTSVPFDTNLALVLPDSKVPVADAYWDITSSKSNLLSSSNLDEWLDVSDSQLTGLTKYNYPLYLFRDSSGTTVKFIASYDWYSFHTSTEYPRWVSNTAITDIVSGSSGTVFNPIVPSDLQWGSSGVYATWGYADGLRTYGTNGRAMSSGIWTTLYHSYLNSSNPEKSFLGNGTYTLSVLFSDGHVASVPFTLNSASTSRKTVQYGGYEFGVFVSENYINRTASEPTRDSEESAITSSRFWADFVFMGICPIQQNDLKEIVYVELTSGSSTDLSGEYIEDVVVMDKDDLNTPSLAVKTDLEITGHQIGGMRPSLPTKGLVWGLVEGGVIKSLQIYNGSAWEAVDGRIWTGERWVPYSAYNVLLMKDMYDVSGIVTPEDYEYIYTEQGFWSWWQKSWNSFVTWLQGSDGGGGESDSSDQTDDSVLPPVTDDDDGSEWKFLDLLVVLKDGAWSIGKGIVVTVFDGFSGLGTAVDGIGGFFDSYSSGGDVFQIYEEGGSVWD